MIANDAYKAIESLDLEPIKFKLMHKTFGEGWSEARACAIEIEYRRFLYLQHMHPGEQASPTADVDTFWHYHILDTVKYAADCERAFGYFMHHYPYLGLLDGDAPGVGEAAAERTRQLYEATFGEAYLRPEAYGPEGAASAQAQASRCTLPCVVAIAPPNMVLARKRSETAAPATAGAHLERMQSRPGRRAARMANHSGARTRAKPSHQARAA